ncbi:Cytokinin riboside 5'-monophosphate phosphoribohydrolase LOG4 [Capsicum baccatum]|uniref:cytokinin riboside 5'-monophosphate phosphoribohydrolase n=1 Tax=Capsicum baccatum TaxID=33114 RepID=A0A2G2WJI5_CAPBA|nr:Cytokinin riboside 5'-monophosphate phosphoribohydrolase LOG4 [Capsicum baccatum]
MEMKSDVMMSKFKRICVFCGCSIGLMSFVSQIVCDDGRLLTGVIPKTLMPIELNGEIVGEVKAVAIMHQRKEEMDRHSDTFIALPDVYGTLNEILEVISWA